MRILIRRHARGWIAWQEDFPKNYQYGDSAFEALGVWIMQNMRRRNWKFDMQDRFAAINREGDPVGE